MKSNLFSHILFNPFICIFQILFISVLLVRFEVSGESTKKIAEECLRNFLFRDFQLSPDGSHLSFINSEKDRNAISTWDIENNKGLFLRNPLGKNVFSYAWVNGDTLVYELEQWHLYFHGLYQVNEDLREVFPISVFDHENYLDDDRFWAINEVPYILSGLPGDPNHALFTGKQNEKLYRNLYRYDSHRRTFSTLERRSAESVSWYADTKGIYRLRARLANEANCFVYDHRWTEDEEWKAVSIPPNSQILGFSVQDNLILFNYVDGDGLHKIQYYDLEKEQVVGTPVTDVTYALDARIIRDNRNQKILALQYEQDRMMTLYFDKNLAKLMELINRSIPGMVHSFMGVSSNGLIIFSSYSDRQPLLIHSMNTATREVNILANVAPWIDKKRMRPMEPIQFESRDGVNLHGYLTLPDSENKGPFPTVIIVHGGPRARDTWGFDPEVQFLARLGYAVLKVNYRGSAGYVPEIANHSLLETCGYVVKDVNDGVAWGIEKGFLDRDRIAIYGGSFGGYAAIASAAFEPEHYKCAVGFAGVYDYMRQLKDSESDGFDEIMRWNQEFYGEYEENEEEFKAISPYYHAEKIKIPVYLMHGGSDQIVFKYQTKKMHNQIKKKGGSSKMDTSIWGVHGFVDEKKRIKHWLNVADFFEKNL